MGAEQDFPEDNWVRATGRRTKAGVIAHCLERELPQCLSKIFGPRPVIKPISQQGWSNFSLQVQGEGSQLWLLRLQSKKHKHQQDLWSPYHKEAWCMNALNRVIPVPKLPEEAVGYFNLSLSGKRSAKEFAFIVQEYIDGYAANKLLPVAGNARFLRELGSIARGIHSKAANGVGTEFNPKKEEFNQHSLGQFFEGEFSRLYTACRYVTENSHTHLLSLREIMRALCEVDSTATLAHRDFLHNWGNVLVNKQRRIVSIIDWELACSGPAFYFELAAMMYAMLRDGIHSSERERRVYWFLEGYGITQEEYRREKAHHVNAFLVWYCLKSVQRFLHLEAVGAIKREPWRRLYAERAARFVRSVLAPGHNRLGRVNAVRSRNRKAA